MDYYIIQNGEANGPYTIGQLRAMWNAGAITGEMLYCREGWSNWFPLSIMAQELEPPAFAPSLKVSPPHLPSNTPKRKPNRAIIIGVVSFGVIMLILIINALTQERNDVHESVAPHIQSATVEAPKQFDPNEPMSPPNYGLTPIPMRLHNQLISTLNQMDDLDALIKRGCTFQEYASDYYPIEQSAQQLQDALPLNDPRMHIFLAACERYQLILVKLANHAPHSNLLSR